MEKRGTHVCACHNEDPYECWASRYKVPRNRNAIEADGGPCECICHSKERGEKDGIEDVY